MDKLVNRPYVATLNLYLIFGRHCMDVH